MTLPKHMDKFRDEESRTEQMVNQLPECEWSVMDWLRNTPPECSKPVYLQRESMVGLDGESFKNLKILSFKDLKRNCLIDDEFIMVMLDRISLLEKQLKQLKKT